MKFRQLLSIIAFVCALSTVSAQEVYVPTSKGEITPLTRAVITGNKTSGKALLAAYGAKLTSSLVLDGKHASVMLPTNSATFYVFIPKNMSIQAWKLTKLKEKKKERELPYMKTGAYSGTKSDMDEIPLMSSKITDELYKLKPLENIEKGEYALVCMENGVPAIVYDFSAQSNLPSYPEVTNDVLMAEFYPAAPEDDANNAASVKDRSNNAESDNIIRWYFDSDPRGARIFYRVISNVPNEVKNTNETYMTTTPLEETKPLNIRGLTYDNAANVVIEIKVTKRGFEEQVKRYNVRQALDQQEISGFFELVEKN